MKLIRPRSARPPTARHIAAYEDIQLNWAAKCQKVNIANQNAWKEQADYMLSAGSPEKPATPGTCSKTIAPLADRQPHKRDLRT